MDCRTVLLFCLAVFLAVIVSASGRTKKVVIHVPYKVKRIKHTHTVYKTVHHHHTHHDHQLASPTEEHEHFHHLLLDEAGAHSAPVPGMIPEFLPDVPLELPLDIPDVPRDIPGLTRHVIPHYRRETTRL